jgi:hypothetical protein
LPNLVTLVVVVLVSEPGRLSRDPGPAFEIFGSLRFRDHLRRPVYEEEPPELDEDADRDGIPAGKDACPNDAEDRDGFEDTDGCPDPDNDRDRVPDASDKCPNEPETTTASRTTTAARTATASWVRVGSRPADCRPIRRCSTTTARRYDPVRRPSST